MSQAEVTVLVPNYKTPELTKLCLRLLRKYSDPKHIHVIVIDNQSADASVDYLRQLNWIELIERDTSQDVSPQASHANALDCALERVQTPYVLSIHTDTMIKQTGWLDFLLAPLKNNANIAGVGSWKLEAKPWLNRLAKKIEYQWQSRYYQWIGKTDHRLEGKDHNRYYLRSHCALYRMDLIRQYQLSFRDGEATAGKVMHEKLISHGHDMIFLPSETLGQYVDHLNHATLILNPTLGARDKTIKKGLRRIKRGLKTLNANQVLADVSLDQ